MSLALVGPSACSTRYVYTVPVGDLVRRPVADTAVTLRTSEGAIVRTTVERLTFDDGRYADLPRPGLGDRITQAARASTGTAFLTVAQRSSAARDADRRALIGRATARESPSRVVTPAPVSASGGRW